MPALFSLSPYTYGLHHGRYSAAGNWLWWSCPDSFSTLTDRRGCCFTSCSVMICIVLDYRAVRFSETYFAQSLLLHLCTEIWYLTIHAAPLYSSVRRTALHLHILYIPHQPMVATCRSVMLRCVAELLDTGSSLIYLRAIQISRWILCFFSELSSSSYLCRPFPGSATFRSTPRLLCVAVIGSEAPRCTYKFIVAHASHIYIPNAIHAICVLPEHMPTAEIDTFMF